MLEKFVRSTTTLAVEKAFKTVTSVSTKSLVVKRKFKTAHNDKDRVTKWWFVIRGEESVLEQLQKEWPTVGIQTSWRLEPVLSYDDDPAAEQLRIVDQSEQPSLASSEQVAGSASQHLLNDQHSSDVEALQSNQSSAHPSFLGP